MLLFIFGFVSFVGLKMQWVIYNLRIMSFVSGQCPCTISWFLLCHFVSYLECLLNGCGISWIDPLSFHLFSPFPLFSSLLFLEKKKKCISLSSSNSIELCINYHSCRAFLLAQIIKNLRAMWETWVWFLGWEDSMEKGMATNSSIFAWRISWTEEPDRLQSMGLQKVR